MKTSTIAGWRACVSKEQVPARRIEAKIDGMACMHGRMLERMGPRDGLRLKLGSSPPVRRRNSWRGSHLREHVTL
jgi:hypothetical protein